MYEDNLKEYLQKTKNIDLIAKQAIEAQKKRIPEKYAHVEAVLGLLNNLISDFNKKSNQYEIDLKARANIEDITEQIKFHQKRKEDCQKLSSTLIQNLNKKQNNIALLEDKVRNLRTSIIQLKTENVKKIIIMNQLEENQRIKSIQEETQFQKTTLKFKKQNQRAMLKTVKCIDSTFSNLTKEKKNLTENLFKQIDQKIRLEKFISESFGFLKEKLLQKQRKSNPYGLNGSLMFKILKNQNQQKSQKMLKDSKLMIYDVLKEKYKNVLQEEKKMSMENLTVGEDDFMNYSSMQIMGLIELKGGVARLTELIKEWDEEKDPTVTISAKNRKKCHV